MGFSGLGESPPECIPWWYNQTAQVCPYGITYPGAVTFPKDAHETLGTGFIWVCILYSYVPTFVMSLGAVELACKRGTRELAFVCFALLILVFNEAVIKKLISEPRPGRYSWEVSGSCTPTCGMPSSHTALSIGYFVLMILDAAFRVVPNKEELTTIHKDIEVAVSNEKDAWYRLCRSAIPIVPQHTMTHSQFVIFIIVWFIILTPVGLSRIVLGDHSVKQVMYGGFTGFLAAVLWFRFMRYLQRRYNHRLGRHFCFFKHNYPLPQFMVRHEVAMGERLELELAWYYDSSNLAPRDEPSMNGRGGNSELGNLDFRNSMLGETGRSREPSFQNSQPSFQHPPTPGGRMHTLSEV